MPSSASNNHKSLHMEIEELPVINDRQYSLYVCRIAAPQGDGTARQSRRSRETAAVRRLVDHCFGTDAIYGHTDSGAPTVDGAAKLSVSHSTSYAALLTGPAGHPLGVDIEQLRPAQLQRVSKRFLSPREFTIFRSDEDLLWAWTAKEAVYKAAGIRALSGPEIALERPYGACAFVGGRRYSLSSVRAADFLAVAAIGPEVNGER